MPSKKPKMLFITDQEILDKIKYLATKESRSNNKQLEHMVKSYIASYEKENGTIDTASNKPQISINKVEQNGPGTINIG